MRFRAAFVAGAAIGYVLGTRAGRERYEQIKRMSRRLTENPTVQEAAGVVRAQAGGLADTARDKVGDRVPGLRRQSDSEPAGPASGVGPG